MELYKQLDNTTYIINVTGNTQIRILNDYENKLLDPCYIKWVDGTIKLTAFNIKQLTFPKKCHVSIIYIKKAPYIDCIWEYANFIPSYNLYPLRDIAQKTLDLFKIKTPLSIDEYEMKKNQRMFDDEYTDIYNNMKYNHKKIINREKITYPTIISKYGKITRLKRKNNNIFNEIITTPVESISSPHRQLNAYGELNDEFDEENDYIIDNSINVSVVV